MQKLLSALIKAKQAFRPIPKDRVNPHYKTKYSTLDAVLGAVEPALHSNGLTLVQVTELMGDRPVLKTYLYHESGDSISSVYPLPEVSEPQKFGGALTYARRYSVCALLSVTADEDDDGEAAKPGQKSTVSLVKAAKFITEKQAHELTDKATSAGYTMDGFKLMVTSSGYKSRAVIPVEMFGDMLKVASDPEQADAWNEASAVGSVQRVAQGVG